MAETCGVKVARTIFMSSFVEKDIFGVKFALNMYFLDKGEIYVCTGRFVTGAE